MSRNIFEIFGRLLLRKMCRVRSRLRVMCCYKPIVFIFIFIFACMMFYSLYTLTDVLKSQPPSPRPRPFSYLLRVREARIGNRSPRENSGHMWTDPDNMWPEDEIPDLGDFYSRSEGASLLLQSYRPLQKPHRSVSPSSHNADRFRDQRRTASNKTILERSKDIDGDSVNDFVNRVMVLNLSRETDGETETGVKRRGRKPFLPVVVVEEHHEVIPYWFQAVNLGLLPPQGNVLLHLDAHADVRVPSVNATFPLFRRPELDELMYLMQRNDMFITGAALTGLFGRYMWIIPPWDTNLSNALGPAGYKCFDVLAGLVQDPEGPQEEQAKKHAEDPPQQMTYKRNPEVCYCVDIHSPDSHDAEMSSQCFVQVNQSHQHPLGVTSKTISREQCQPRVHIVAEMAMEDKAIELLNVTKGRMTSDKIHRNHEANPQSPFADNSTIWLGNQESVILDIDEDYYGVEAAITPLHDALLDDRDLDTISETVSRIFCAREAQQEVRADRIFTELVERIHKDLLLRQQCKCVNESDSDLENFSTKLNRELKNSSVVELLCANHSLDRDDLVASLIQDLFSLSSRQLLALGQVGICLKESPRTMGFEPSRGMKVCTGYNRPGNSAVIFHVPDRREVDERSLQLRRLLERGRFTPRIVTVARSVRDGYTPRGLFRTIEEDVLVTLKDVYPQGMALDSVVYDSQLWRGREGWTDRGGRDWGSAA